MNATPTTIRDRGQLTIPDSIREQLAWLTSGSVVTIDVASEEEIHITPYKTQKKPNWEKIWHLIHLTRSFKSKGQAQSLSEFIIKDRENH